MFLSILLAVVVAFIVAATTHMLNGGGLTEKVETRTGRERKKFAGLNKVGEYGWIKASLAGLLVGLIAWLGTEEYFNWLWLAPVSAIVMAAGFVIIMIWWCQEGATVKEGIWFTLLALICFWVMKGAAYATTSLWDNFFWTKVVTTLPYLMLAATLGLIVCDGLYDRYRHPDYYGKDPQRYRMLSIIAAVVTVALVIALLAMGLAGILLPKGWKEAKAEKPEKTTEIVEELAADDNEIDEEDGLFAQVPTRKDGNRKDADFSKKLAELAGNGTVTAEVPKQIILQNCAHDASWLADWAYTFGLWGDPNNWEPLVTEDGKYLSERGKRLFYELKGAFSILSWERDFAPNDGWNTGFSGGQNVVAEAPGISGDLAATKVSFRGEVVCWVMDRCGNIVYPAETAVSSVLPKGETDEQLPKKDPTKGVQGELTAPNDDLGPGPDTNSGAGALESKKDLSSNSNHNDNYSKTIQGIADVNVVQKRGGDSNAPSTATPASVPVDNNGSNGTGNGGIDTPTPVAPPDTPLANTVTNPAGEWGGPPD